MFPIPKKVVRIEQDGKYAFVEDSVTGLPVGELTVTEPPQNPPSGVGKIVWPDLKPKHKEANMRQEMWTFDEGNVILQWPSTMTEESYKEFADWLELTKRKIQRSIEKNKGRSDNEHEGSS